VIGGEKTSPQALATVVDLCKKLGKTPIVVGDCPGFLVNRILLPCVNEMMLMLEEGYSAESLDDAFTSFGMPMKPFILADEVGNDVTYKAGKSMEKGYGARMQPAAIMHLIVEKDLLGHKKKKGFYLYNGNGIKSNPEIKELIHSVGRLQKENPVEDIIPRFFYPMINEAARCLEEKIITRADYLDLALILGIGFPPFKGGLLRYADRVGVRHILDKLKELEDKAKSRSGISARYTPCKLLVDMAEGNKSFY
jgi:3-hydroxyacyl-CoA dehydrogenase/enoyl-CoA hydratase/3-hydroxybutyryl-CoA epimerase